MENKQSIAEVCRNLGVSRNAMDRWLAAEADIHDDDKVRMHKMEAEIRQLQISADMLYLNRSEKSRKPQMAVI